MTWLLIAAAWVLVAVVGALALAHAIHVAEERRRAYDSRLRADVPGWSAAGPAGEAFVPVPRNASDADWHLPRGHRRPGAA